MSVRTISEALAYYKTVAGAEGQSPKTVLWKTTAVHLFAQFLGGDASIHDVTAHDLRRFIVALRGRRLYQDHPFTRPQARLLSDVAVQTYVRGLRAFWSFLHREGLITTNPFSQVKVPRATKKQVAIFTEEGLRRILAQPDRTMATGFRDYAMLLVLTDTQIRLGELVGLALDGADLEERTLRVLGKGKKERVVPMGRRVAATIARYVAKWRPETACDRLFVTRDGSPLSLGRVQKLVKRYGLRAGIKGVRLSPHTFRHTGSVLFIRNGGDAFALQRKLGHETLTMTRHYCNLADSDVRAAHARASPVDRLGL